MFPRTEAGHLRDLGRRLLTASVDEQVRTDGSPVLDEMTLRAPHDDSLQLLFPPSLTTSHFSEEEPPGKPRGSPPLCPPSRCPCRPRT